MTNDVDAGRQPAGPARRYPGRYLVYGLGVLGVIFFGFVVLLATRLSPAADRFHNRTPATRLTEKSQP